MWELPAAPGGPPPKAWDPRLGLSRLGWPALRKLLLPLGGGAVALRPMLPLLMPAGSCSEDHVEMSM